VELWFDGNDRTCSISSVRIFMPKITLNSVKGNSYFCSGRLSVGVYIHNKTAILIDSGIDRDNAKDINKALVEAGYTVGAIINTHHHADHCGGNNYFQKTYPGLRIFATQFECVFIDSPFMMPLCFCSGALPFAELRNKYLEAEPSVTTDVIVDYKDQEINIDGALFKIVTLPGHTFGSIGVITPDNVFYAGDAIFADETFNKHGILFYTDINSSLESFKKIATLAVDATVFYHSGVAYELAPVAQKHAQRMIETKDAIASMIKSSEQGTSIDVLTQQVMQKYAIPESIMSFTLTKTCVNAYVTQLSLEKEVVLKMSDGLLKVVSQSLN